MENQMELNDSKLLSLYRKDWVFAAEHSLKSITWSKSREIIEAVQNHDMVAVRAAHGLGKTHTAALICVLFYNLFPSSRVITTAPTFKQVKYLLWKEIGGLYNKNNGLIGRSNKTEIVDEKDPKHVFYGFSTKFQENAEGNHAKFMLYVFDEAKGLPKFWYDSARGALGGKHNKWVVISTTDGVRENSEFAKCFRAGSKWHKIKITSFDGPEFTGEYFRRLKFIDGSVDNFEYEYLDYETAEIPLNGRKYVEMARDPVTGWGEDSPLYKCKVLAEICDMNRDGIFRLSRIYKMYENHKDDNFDKTGKKRAGIDVAWGGAADTICYKAQGLYVLDDPLKISTEDLPDREMIKIQADKIEDYLNDPLREFEIRIDANSGGVGLASELESRGWEVLKIKSQSKPSEKFANEYSDIVSECWFEVARIADKIACPKNDTLEAELINRREGNQAGGKRSVEGKKVYMKRCSCLSPDNADAFLLCMHEFPKETAVVKEVPYDFY